MPKPQKNKKKFSVFGSLARPQSYYCYDCFMSVSCVRSATFCAGYSIRAKNGYGRHRPCKIVLLTLVTPRGVTDLYLSWGINIEYARTAYHKTCGTEYQKPYLRFNSQAPYYKWNMAQARPTSVSDISRSLQSWVSTTHRSYSQLTFFIFLSKTIYGTV